MEEKILEMLAELCEDDIVKSRKDIDLFDTGLLDSLTFAELLFNIEDNFQVIIAPSEVEHADFNTPEKIVQMVMARAQA